MSRICSTLAVLALLACAAAPAADRSSATLSIGRNLHVAGGSVATPAEVGGDFTAFGGRVVVGHAVGADATLAGGSVQVAAPVGDDLRAAGGDVSITSTVGGELYAAGGNVHLAANAAVAHDAAIAAGTLAIDGKVGGKLTAAARSIVVNGQIGGDVRLRGERIELGPNARIGGALNYRAAQLVKADGAVIDGAIIADGDDGDDRSPRHGGMHERQGRMQRGDREPMPALGIGSAFGFVALLALSALAVSAAPKLPSRLADAVTSAPWRAAGVGGALILGVPLLALLLVPTLLGIPLAFALMLLYPPLLLAGFVAGVLLLAQRIGAALRPAAQPSRLSAIGFVALTLLALVLLGWVPVVGALALLALTIVGLGAAALTFFALRAPA